MRQSSPGLGVSLGRPSLQGPRVQLQRGPGSTAGASQRPHRLAPAGRGAAVGGAVSTRGEAEPALPSHGLTAPGQGCLSTETQPQGRCPQSQGPPPGLGTAFSSTGRMLQAQPRVRPVPQPRARGFP